MPCMGHKMRSLGRGHMLDRYARQLIDPPLNQIGRGLAARGFTANGVTLIGLGLGLFAALLIAVGQFGWALVPLLASSNSCARARMSLGLEKAAVTSACAGSGVQR